MKKLIALLILAGCASNTGAPNRSSFNIAEDSGVSPVFVPFDFPAADAGTQVFDVPDSHVDVVVVEDDSGESTVDSSVPAHTPVPADDSGTSNTGQADATVNDREDSGLVDPVTVEDAGDIVDATSSASEPDAYMEPLPQYLSRVRNIVTAVDFGTENLDVHLSGVQLIEPGRFNTISTGIRWMVRDPNYAGIRYISYESSWVSTGTSEETANNTVELFTSGNFEANLCSFDYLGGFENWNFVSDSYCPEGCFRVVCSETVEGLELANMLLEVKGE